MPRIVSAFLTLLMLSCNLASPYRQPWIDFPSHWRHDHCEEVSDYNIRWWEDFGDPVLILLIKEAISYNPDLWEASERLSEFYARFRIAVANRWPQIYGQISGQKMENAPALMPLQGIPLVSDQFAILANLSWELDFFSKLKNLSTAAWFDWLSHSHARRTVILSLVTSVAIAYLELREFDLQLQISKETLKSREESLRLARLRFEGGLTSEIEVYQAQSEVGIAAASVVQFELQIAQTEDLISILVGAPPREIQRGLTLQEMATDAPIPAGIPASIISQRPDVQRAESDLIAAGFRVGAARAELFPDITLTASVGQQSMQLSNLFTSPASTYMYGVNLAQVLIDGGKTWAGIAAEQSRQWQLVYRFQSVVLTALKEVEDALIAHKLAKDMVQIQRDRVDALKKYLHLANLQYENGQTDYLSVLDAERNLFSAQLDLASALADVLLTRVTIYKALGGDWVNLTEDELDCY